MTVTVPFGATAKVVLPMTSATINGEAVNGSELSLGSGTYTIVGK